MNDLRKVYLVDMSNVNIRQIDFADLKKGNRFRMFEADGTPVISNGCKILEAISDVYINKDGFVIIDIKEIS